MTSFTIDSIKINKIIQYGSCILDNNSIEFESYLTQMLNEFYPDAEKEIIYTMKSWADFPDLEMFTLADLKQIEIHFINKNMYKEYKPHQLVEIVPVIKSSTVFCSNINGGIGIAEFGSWNQIMTMIQTSNGQPLYFFFNKWSNGLRWNAKGLKSHVLFVDIITQLWKSGDYESNNSSPDSKVDKQDIMNEILPMISKLIDENSKLQKQIDELNERLNQQYQPKYNYEEMKTKRAVLHRELRNIYRFFKKGIANTYAPIAIAVPVVPKND